MPRAPRKRPAPARAAAAAVPPSSRERQVFLEFSAALTGFTVVELEGTGNVDTHLGQLWTIVGAEICRDLLQAAQLTLAHADEEQRDQAIRNTVWNSPRLGPVVQALVRLWYTGKWNPLSAQWQETYRWDHPDPNGGAVTVAPQAYIESLVWSAIGAHPPGAKPTGHGSWAYPPEAAPGRVRLQVKS